MSAAPVIALFPEASFGAALNCVGIAQELRAKGATPVFICHPGFTGVFADYGFKEYHLPATPVSSAQTIEEDWQSFITTHLPHFDLSPLEQLPTYVAPTWEAIVDSAIAVEDGLADVLARIRPDAILLDNVIMFPAVARAGCPWVRIVSCAETELPDPNIPPYLSGLVAEDTEGCRRFEHAYLRYTNAAHKRYNTFRKTRGLPPLEPGVFLEPSPTLNLLLAPSAVRYQRAHGLPPDRFVFLDGCVRSETAFTPPALPAAAEAPMVYISFGSLGAIDTVLIGRMIDVFAGMQARFLINVGGFLDAYDNVPDNVYLSDWFPQPSAVAHCALFLHHGGNNSFCEALYHGVPSLVMPYCWDGHDNAQRAEVMGVGLRLSRSDWSPDDLRDRILSLLGDHEMARRLSAISRGMQADPGTRRAAEAVLKIARPRQSGRRQADHGARV